MLLLLLLAVSKHGGYCQCCCCCHCCRCHCQCCSSCCHHSADCLNAAARRPLDVKYVFLSTAPSWRREVRSGCQACWQTCSLLRAVIQRRIAVSLGSMTDLKACCLKAQAHCFSQLDDGIPGSLPHSARLQGSMPSSAQRLTSRLAALLGSRTDLKARCFAQLDHGLPGTLPHSARRRDFKASFFARLDN